MSEDIYHAIEKLLKRHGRALDLKTEVLNSKAKTKKAQLHLYGNKKISIAGLPVRQTYVAGVIEQKHFTGFYFMPMYSHPKQFTIKNQDLKRMRKGKSCINLKGLTPEMVSELDQMLKKGIKLYKKQGWI